MNSIEEALKRKKALTPDSRHHREDVRANNSIAEYMQTIKALRNAAKRTGKDILIIPRVRHMWGKR